MKAKLPVDAQGKPVHPIKADALKPAVDSYQGSRQAVSRWRMVFPVSTHNYELRYWLAAGGMHPGFYSPSDVSGQIKADVLLSVTPPPQMPAALEAGTINGYCVGEPWNQQAIFKGVGVPVITDLEIWKNNPEKVFGVTRAWAEKHPNTHLALLKALIRAGIWLDANNGANRKEAAQILSRSEYVGADYRVIANSMTGTFEYGRGDKRSLPDFNVFFRYYATYPYYSDAVWYLTQMRRWGQIPQSQAGPVVSSRRRRKCIAPNPTCGRRACWWKRRKRSRKTFRGTATASVRRPRSSSTASSTTAASPMSICKSSRSGLKQGQVIESGNVVAKQDRGAT